MKNQWFRLYAEFLHDPKVQMMSEQYQRRLLMLMCLRCNGDVTLHDDEIAFQLRIGTVEWSETKREFIAKGFIDEANNLLNWDKRQYRSDTSAERVRKHREAKREMDVTECNVTVTPPDTDTDTDTERKNNSHKKKIEKPEDVSETVFNDFLTLRKSHKAPVTETAIAGLRKKASVAGMTLEAVMAMMCDRGWRGFEPDWIKTDQKPIKNEPPPDPTRAIPQSEYEFAKKMLKSGFNPSQHQRIIERYESQNQVRH